MHMRVLLDQHDPTRPESCDLAEVLVGLDEALLQERPLLQQALHDFGYELGRQLRDYSGNVVGVELRTITLLVIRQKLAVAEEHATRR